MGECKHLIGIYSRNGELMSLNELKELIKERQIFNGRIARDPVFKDCKSLYQKLWSLNDYADFRKSVDITRFKYCPLCGEKIDWKGIAKENKNG